MAQWLTADDADIEEVLAYLWTDAPLEEPKVLGMFLGAAKSQCIAYAPELPADADGIPDEWVIAQAMQARNIYNAGANASTGTDPSGGGYGIATYPLDWHVKQLLRPQRAVGSIW